MTRRMSGPHDDRRRSVITAVLRVRVGSALPGPVRGALAAAMSARVRLSPDDATPEEAHGWRGKYYVGVNRTPTSQGVYGRCRQSALDPCPCAT